MGVNAVRLQSLAQEAARLKRLEGKLSASTPTPDLSPLEGERSHAPPPICVAPRIYGCSAAGMAIRPPSSW
jgi:hypothetical protein